jgi:hypothetical protein
MKHILLLSALVITASLAAQDIAGIRAAASTALDQKDYAKCAAVYAPLGRQRQDAETLYYVASCLVLDRKKDAAFAALDSMVDFWWANTSLLENDPNLALLREDSRWKMIIARSEANWAVRFGDTNRELSAIAAADQSDRQTQPIDWKSMAEHDQDRRKHVEEILAAGGARTTTDYCNAALVMQHGADSASYRKAYELAVCGVEIDQMRGGCKGLAAAALDRYLQSIGKPQIYGTQLHRVNGIWTLDPIDETALTDEERAKWNVPPLAEMKRRVAEANKPH